MKKIMFFGFIVSVLMGQSLVFAAPGEDPVDASATALTTKGLEPARPAWLMLV